MQDKAVEIAKLVIDIGCQPRETLNPEAVQEYAELLREGVKLPPIEVVDVDGDLVVIDGFHRVAACVHAREGFIRAVIVEEGDLGRARWLAAGANQGHGVRRTNADKRAAVKLALESDIGQEQSLRVIAEHVGVHHSFVAKVRDEVSTNDTPGEAPAPEPPEEQEAPEAPDEQPDPDMYVTAAKVLFKAYRRICKVLGEEDAVCEAAYVAYEKAKEREL